MSITKFFPSKQQKINQSSEQNSRTIGLVVALLFLGLAIAFPLPPLSFLQPEISAGSGLITRVELTNFSLEKGAKDDGLVVMAHLKNTSKSAAQSVSIGFLKGDEVSSFLQSKGNNSGVSIESGQEVKFPVVPLSELLVAIQSNCPACFFLGVSKEVKMPVENIAQLCKESFGMGRPCRMEYSYFPIVLEKKFTTVSGDEFSGRNSLFVYLSRSFKTAYPLPKN